MDDATWPLQFGLFIVLLYITTQDVSAANELYFDSSNCTQLDGSGVLVHFNCSLAKANRQRRTFNMEMQFGRDVNKLRVDMLVSLPAQQQQPKQHGGLGGGGGALVLFNVSRLNACALFVNGNVKDMILWLRKPLLHYSNLPLRCPLVKQKLYFIRGLRFEAQLLPQLPLIGGGGGGGGGGGSAAASEGPIIEIAFTLAEERLKLFAGVTRLRYGTRNERRG